MPPKARIAPLTDEQRELAGRPEYVEMARNYAIPWKRRYPWLFDDIESAAMEGLIKAARFYDAGSGLRFSTFLYHCVRSKVLDFLRFFVRPVGYREGNVEMPATESVPFDHEMNQPDSGADPVGWELDAEAGVEELTRTLPDMYRRALRLYYLHADATQESVGRMLGVCESRANQLWKAGRAMIRERFPEGVYT